MADDAYSERSRGWPAGRGDDPAAVSDARAWGRSALPAVLGRPPGPDLARDVELLLSELVANAVRHGGGVEGVTMSAEAGSLCIEVRDHDPAEPVLTADDGLDHGWGMMIVDRLSTGWGVQQHADDGKSVWLRLPLRSRS